MKGRRHLLCWVPWRELTQSLQLLVRDPIEWVFPSPHLETEISSFRNIVIFFFFFLFRILGDGQRPQLYWFLATTILCPHMRKRPSDWRGNQMYIIFLYQFPFPPRDFKSYNDDMYTYPNKHRIS
jgi:hypothetical protein